MFSFKAFGTQIEVRFLFVAVCTLFLLVDKTGVGVLGLCACLIHEMGHITAFAIIGYKPKKLVFEVSGIRLIKPTQKMSFGKEMLVLISGSAVNFSIFAIFSYTLDTVSNLSIFACVHLVLGTINLLPFDGLDGVEILRLILSRWMLPKTAYRIEKGTQILFLILLCVSSVFVMVNSGFNITIIILLLYVVILSFFKR